MDSLVLLPLGSWQLWPQVLNPGYVDQRQIILDHDHSICQSLVHCQRRVTIFIDHILILQSFIHSVSFKVVILAIHLFFKKGDGRFNNSVVSIVFVYFNKSMLLFIVCGFVRFKFTNIQLLSVKT